VGEGLLQNGAVQLLAGKVPCCNEELSEPEGRSVRTVLAELEVKEGIQLPLGKEVVALEDLAKFFPGALLFCYGEIELFVADMP
jgi:hypothetical protein